MSIKELGKHIAKELTKEFSEEEIAEINVADVIKTVKEKLQKIE